jgi:hypothetical protein
VCAPSRNGSGEVGLVDDVVGQKTSIKCSMTGIPPHQRRHFFILNRRLEVAAYRMRFTGTKFTTLAASC